MPNQLCQTVHDSDVADGGSRANSCTKHFETLCILLHVVMYINITNDYGAGEELTRH